VVVENHDCSWIHGIGPRHVKVLGAVTIGTPKVAGYFNITFEEPGKTARIVSRDTGVRRVMANAKYSVKILAFADHTSLFLAVTIHSLRAVAETFDAAPRRGVTRDADAVRAISTAFAPDPVASRADTRYTILLLARSHYTPAGNTMADSEYSIARSRIFSDDPGDGLFV
jgi:hypothetical protein